MTELALPHIDFKYNTNIVCFFAHRNRQIDKCILLLSECVFSATNNSANSFSMFNRSIMSDIQRDNRVVSLSSRAGIRNSLVTILDQLQRCQKSLNEFLEVHTCIFVCKDIYAYVTCFKHHNFFLMCLCVVIAGEALCLPTVLFHRRWWSVRDSWTSNQPNSHPVTPKETLCGSETNVLFCSVLCFVIIRSVPFVCSLLLSYLFLL